MKVKIYHILVVLCLAIAGPAGILSGYSQDVGGPAFDVYDNDNENERERFTLSPGETEPTHHHKYATSPIAAKDSLNSVRVPAVQRNVKNTGESSKPASAGKTKEDDDSILSFNFLYYIIQKYKLQDIVD
jgi:hypothetical protein